MLSMHTFICIFKESSNFAVKWKQFRFLSNKTVLKWIAMKKHFFIEGGILSMEHRFSFFIFEKNTSTTACLQNYSKVYFQQNSECSKFSSQKLFTLKLCLCGKLKLSYRCYEQVQNRFKKAQVRTKVRHNYVVKIGTLHEFIKLFRKN